MVNPVIDNFHSILASMPTQELNALDQEVNRLYKGGMSLHDIALRFIGAVHYVAEMRDREVM